MTQVELLQTLSIRRKVERYLEIGSNNNQKYFSQISVPFKIRVDQTCICYGSLCMTSSDYFKYNTQFFDLVFLDGPKNEYYMGKDFAGSLKCIDENGIIVINDSLSRGVYKMIPELQTVDGIDYETYEVVEGVTVIWRDRSIRAKDTFPVIKNRKDFMKHRDLYKIKKVS